MQIHANTLVFYANPCKSLQICLLLLQIHANPVVFYANPCKYSRFLCKYCRFYANMCKYCHLLCKYKRFLCKCIFCSKSSKYFKTRICFSKMFHHLSKKRVLCTLEPKSGCICIKCWVLKYFERFEQKMHLHKNICKKVSVFALICIKK